jgi:hypothetical protein
VLERIGPRFVGEVFFALAISMIPAAIGVAVLKYRLYDIDRVINRTLVYGLLTALLAAELLGVANQTMQPTTVS